MRADGDVEPSAEHRKPGHETESKAGRGVSENDGVTAEGGDDERDSG